MDSRRRQVITPARAAVTAGTLLLALTVSACSPEAAGTAAPTKLTTATPTTDATGPLPTRSTIPTVAAPVPTRSTPATTPTAPAPTRSVPAPAQTTTPAAAPTRTPASKPAPAVEPVSAPKPTKPAAPPVKIVLENGDVSAQVRSVQARLRQIGWFSGDVTDRYGSLTVAAVSGFQRKRGLPVTGKLDQTTYARLLAMTGRPTADDLANVKPQPPEPATTPTTPSTKPAPGKPTTNGITWDVDQRCLTGRVMCISKTARTLTWVIDGVPQLQFAVRFGSDELPTREGTFSVFKKKVDVISNLYHTPMPYSMFFSGGQAVHYSSNFARLGYAGASHGCVNVRDRAGIIRLYNESRVGDKVVVHW